MSKRDDREKSMWYCPHCVMWCGWKLDECQDGHSQPRWPLRAADVDRKPAWEVTRRDRLRAKFRGLL